MGLVRRDWVCKTRGTGNSPEGGSSAWIPQVSSSCKSPTMNKINTCKRHACLPAEAPLAPFPGAPPFPHGEDTRG